MKVLGKRVLIEQMMVKKESKIIRLDPGSKDGLAPNSEDFDITFTVLQVGPDCPKEDSIQVGDKPIFGKHLQFSTVKVLEKTDKKVVVHAIVEYDDIIGIDD